MRAQPFGFANLLAAVDFYAERPARDRRGRRPGARRRPPRCCRASARAYLPNRTLMVLDPRDAAPRPPLLEGKGQVDGKPTVYVCHRMTCSPPATRWDEIEPLP